MRLSSRKAGEPALKVRNNRDTSARDVPTVISCRASDDVFAVSAGPKHP